MRPKNAVEIDRLRVNWTVLERIREAALELKNLNDLPITWVGQHTNEHHALDAIFTEDFDKAIQICDGNYEPPDPPGWEGGFAKNY